MIETDVIKQESLPPLEMGVESLSPSSETLMSLGLFLQKRFQKLKILREQSQWEDEKANAFNAYHMAPKSRPLPYVGAANLSCPLPRIGVDSFHSNVMGSLFAEENRMRLKPVIIQKDLVGRAKKAARYMTYVLNHEVKFYNVMDDADKKAQMFGISYMEPYYEKEEIWETVDVVQTKQEQVKNPMTGEMEMKERKSTKREKKRKTVFDGVRVRSLPVESIYKSPFLNTLEECVREDAVFKVFQINWSKVVERSKSRDERPVLYRKEAVDRIRVYVKEKILKNNSSLEMARADNDGFYIDYLGADEPIDLAEGYLWYDIDNDGMKEEIRATFDPKSAMVLRVSLSPCRITETIPRPVDERGYGEGIPKICLPLSDEWENFHNTRSNAGQWENTTFGFYRAGGRFNPQKIIIQPGHFYPVDDPREVSFAQPPRVGSSYFQEEQMILSYFERLFALDENMQGVGSSRRRSATEALKVSTRAGIRFGNPFNRIVESVNKLLKHIWELNRECAPEDKEFYVIGESNSSPLFDRMKKYEYSANMEFSVVISSVFDQQMIQDKMMLAYRLFMVNPFVQQHPEVLWDLSQKTLDALNIDVEIPKPDQAKTISPYEEHDLFQRGESPEPQVGEDTDHHYQIHMQQLNSESIKDWEHDAVQRLILHIDKTTILKKTLESANLNKSGQFAGMPGGQNGQKQPPVTSTRNPTQTFNNMRVGERSNSMKQNLKNGANGAQVQGPSNVEESINQITGSLY